MMETMVVLAVASMLAAMALPSMRGTITRSYSTTISDRLLTDLSLARSQAVMSTFPSVMCPSTDRSTCTGHDDWSSGWIVFTELNHSDQRSASEPVISTVTSSDLGGLRVISSSGRTHVRFLPDGIGGGTNLTMHVCDGSKLTSRVVVNISGRARIESPDTGDTACD